MEKKAVERTIVAFQQDRAGDWLAVLDCGHTRHLRHDPPWMERAWLTSEAERRRRIGQRIPCQTCAELAAGSVPSSEERRRIAEAVKAACLQAALEAYQHAQLSGLCREGAWDLAVDAIRSLDVTKVLEKLP